MADDAAALLDQQQQQQQPREAPEQNVDMADAEKKKMKMKDFDDIP